MKPEAGIYYCLSFCLPVCASCPTGFSPFLLSFIFQSLSCSFCRPSVRAWTGNRGRATCYPSTSRRWKSGPWEPCTAGRDDRWWPERRKEAQTSFRNDGSFEHHNCPHPLICHHARFGVHMFGHTAYRWSTCPAPQLWDNMFTFRTKRNMRKILICDSKLLFVVHSEKEQKMLGRGWL